MFITRITRYPCHDCEHTKTCEWSFTDYMYTCGGKEMGKKYVIELEDRVSENAKGEPLYFVKGFNNLSLDETALKKLTPLDDYSDEEHKFEVGDVVEVRLEDGYYTAIITSINSNIDVVRVLFKDGDVKNIFDKKRLRFLNKNFSKSLHVLLDDLM